MSAKNFSRKLFTCGYLGILVILFIPAGLVGAQQDLPLPVQSQQQTCGDASVPFYSAIHSAEAGTYSVYGRLGRAGQQASASVYVQSLGSQDCQTIGTAQVSGDAWQKLGVWQSSGPQTGASFIFSSGAIDGLPDANRPTVMLVPDKNPICQPTTECEVNIAGNKGVVRASGTLLNEDTLHLVTAKDPGLDKVVRVNYYIDNLPVYSTTSLEPFNLRYVSSGKHNLTRVVVYESRQQIIINEIVDRDFANVVNHTFFSLVYGQKTLLQIFAIIGGLLIICSLALALARRIYKQRLWKKHHFATAPVPGSPVSTPRDPSVYNISKPDNFLVSLIRQGIPLLMLAAIGLILMVAVDSFAVQLYQTDGVSMRTTLESGDRLLVNKLPKTWATISRRQYVPKRGHVIIVKKNQSPLLGEIMTDFGQQYYVKRVIARPGERVVIAGGVIKVYPSDGSPAILPDLGVRWANNIQAPVNETIDIVLGPDELFVVGDNRPESVDSRVFGAVKVDDVIGRAVLDLTPLTRTKRL